MRTARAALLALVCAAAAAPLSAQQDSIEVTALRFPGASALSGSLIRGEIMTRATRCRSPLFALLCRVGAPFGTKERRYLPDTTEVVRDAERIATLYEAWGYPHATVEPRIIRRGSSSAVVEFHVAEGEPLLVEHIDVTGMDAVPRVRLPRTLPLAVNEPYALPRLEATEAYIAALLAEHGHPYATVEVGGSVDEARMRARLVFDVDPGPAAVFGGVTVQATSPVTEDVVRERLSLRPGAPFSTSALERTERELYELPIVARASAGARLVDGTTVLPVEVLVESRRAHGLDVEGTLSSTDCVELSSFWRDRWFMGGPRLLSVGASFSNLGARQANGSFPCSAAGKDEYGDVNYYAQAELWQPWLFSARNTGLLRVFASRESSPGVYIQQGFGGEVAVARDFGQRLHAQLGYAPERNSLDAVSLYFCSNYGQCTQEEVASLSSVHWLAPVQLQLRWATRGAGELQRPDPVTGLAWSANPLPLWRHRVTALLEGAHAVTASDYAFQRAIVEASTTRGRGGIELAGRVRFGISTGDDLLPPQLRLYSGGLNTVRGSAQNLVGPKVLVMDAADVAPPSPSATPLPCPECGIGVLDPNRASVRPTGGDRVLEGNVEARYWLSSMLQLAAFVDYGRITGTQLHDVADYDHTQQLITPGIGVRLITDLGPIRFDIGYDPGRAKRYPVFTEIDGDVRYVGTALFDPYGWDGASGAKRFLRRMQFHMAIGQAF